MSSEADHILTEKRLLLRFWQSATGFWRTPRAWGMIIFLISIMLLQLLVYYRRMTLVSHTNFLRVYPDF